MLVVAIPKSASTSLMDTLGKLHDLPARQVFFRDHPMPAGMSLLPKYHSDIREFTPNEIQRFMDSSAVYKQHIPPTANNLSLLKGHKKVVLLRPPMEIVEAYWRAEKKRLHEPRAEFEGAGTIEAWNARAGENGLLSDLALFHDGWTREAQSETECVLTVAYAELIGDAASVINRVERFFGLPETNGTIELSKKRYSRLSGAEAFWLKVRGAVRGKLGRRF